MDCTVVSILTTTPLFKPCEGCDPNPMILIFPSLETSPTSVTTLEVPMSIPTKRSFKGFFGIYYSSHFFPAHCYPVRITQINIIHIICTQSDDFWIHFHKLIQTSQDVLVSNLHGNAIIQCQFPCQKGR